jgi:pimeloyl-ACP methyl ester carboxylesterase
LDTSNPLVARSQAQRLPEIGSPDIVWVTCPAEAQALGATCGYLPVPLFRWIDESGVEKHKDAPQIKIYFEVYAHSNSGPAISAIVPNDGGPGDSTSNGRVQWLTTFAANLDVHDLLLVDNRGTGQSAALDCPGLQHGLAPSLKDAIVQCAAELGNTSSQWGSGNVAFDVDAVRQALGYDLIDYYGGSSGGMDASAYAAWFPQHVRSVILDSANSPATAAPFNDAYNANADPLVVRLLCQRSPTCQPDHPDPEWELTALIRAVRAHPVEGYAYDASGNLKFVTVDEKVLVLITNLPNGPWQDTGELLATWRAFRQGDSLPLLRLGAEESFVALGDSGVDPNVYSVGDQYDNQCIDYDGDSPYNYQEPLSQRLAAYWRLVKKLPSDFFSPFSISVGTDFDYELTRQCAYWEEPTRHIPLVPKDAVYPDVPVLATVSDMDLVPIAMVKLAADQFPFSSLVIIPEAFHEPVLSNACAAGLATNFIETLQLGDTTCTQAPEVVWPGMGRFPELAADARPAEVDPNGHNEIGEAERKVVTVAVAAAIDAIKRSTIGSGNGVCLRAGTFSTVPNSTGQVTTLVGCAFASDVQVDGAVTWNSGSDLSLTADITVKGTGTTGGTLHVSGAFHAPGPVGNYSVSGQLGGKRVAVLIPES